MILQDVKLAEHCFVHQVDLSLHLGMTSVLHVIQIIIVSIGVLKILTSTPCRSRHMEAISMFTLSNCPKPIACAIIITWWPVPGLSRRYGMLYLKYKNATAYMDLTKNNMDHTLRQWQVGTTVWRRLRPGTPATHSRANCKQMSVFDTEQDQVNYFRYLSSLLSRTMCTLR